ncbi:MAG TPA: hypothetical protein VEG64_07925 [Candidatus Sulfotelmatobacter sp.]|nr:hypothetical protein [Candidatus Sulfotelmatobacter sp.]
MSRLAPILANLLVLVAAVGFGHLLNRLLPRNFLRLDRIAFTIVGGLGLLGVILFCVGQVWFSRAAILLIVGLGFLLGIRPIVAAARNSALIVRNSLGPAIPMIVVVAVVSMAGIGGLAQATGDMGADAIAYHYLGPKVWLREGVIRPVVDECHTAFPATVESLYAALMSIGGERAPQFFAFVGIASALLAAASLSMRLGGGASSAWWTAALVATVPVFFRGGSDGFIDAMLAGFILCAARIGFDATQRKEFVLFGVLSGIALSAKYTALIAWILLTFCAFVVAVRSRHRGYAAVLKDLGIATMAAAVIGCPAYVRNWILLGCPIYPPPPMLARFFHVKYMSPQAIQYLTGWIEYFGRGMSHGFWSFLKLPLNLTYHTANFRGAGGIGLVPLALAPFGAVASWRNGFAKGLILYATVQTMAWFVTDQEARFLMPIYILAVIFGVAGWEYVNRLGTRYGRALAGLVVACSILYGLVMIVSGSREDMHAALSASFEAKRRNAEIPYLASFEYLNREPSVRKILILNPYVPGYYCDKPYVKPVGRWGEETIPEAANLEAVFSQLPALGVTHVLDSGGIYGGFRLAQDHPGLRFVFQRPDQRIYAVTSLP